MAIVPLILFLIIFLFSRWLKGSAWAGITGAALLIGVLVYGVHLFRGEADLAGRFERGEKWYDYFKQLDRVRTDMTYFSPGSGFDCANQHSLAKQPTLAEMVDVVGRSDRGEDGALIWERLYNRESRPDFSYTYRARFDPKDKRLYKLGWRRNYSAEKRDPSHLRFIPTGRTLAMD
jgi:hypothetical protein